MNFGVGTMMQIGFRLISNRDAIMQTWSQVAPLVQDAMRVAPQVKQLIDQIAPEVLQAPQTEPKFDVKWVQQSLNTLVNAGLVVDGVMGPMTKKVIEDFQRANGLSVDGWAGAATSAAINAALAKSKA